MLDDGSPVEQSSAPSSPATRAEQPREQAPCVTASAASVHETARDETARDETARDEAASDETPRYEAPRDEAPRDEAPRDEASRDEPRPASASTSPRQNVAEKRERKRQARKRARKASRQRNQRNTSIYLTGLPSDVTEQQLASFCAKCGILLPDANTGRARVKIYRDEQGAAKGDALVTYALRPSVENALQLLDGACFRDGQFPVRVCEASFEHKKARTESGRTESSGVREGSDAPRAWRHLFVREKMSWNEEDEQRNAPNASRIVILKNVFDVKTADYDMIREDMLDGCAECGEVEQVTVFERNAEGAVAVKFKWIQSCLKCIEVMNGRWYDGRQLRAELYDGHSDYRYKETDADRAERDRKWQQWLEQSEAQSRNEGSKPTTC